MMGVFADNKEENRVSAPVIVNPAVEEFALERVEKDGVLVLASSDVLSHFLVIQNVERLLSPVFLCLVKYIEFV